MMGKYGYAARGLGPVRPGVSRVQDCLFKVRDDQPSPALTQTIYGEFVSIDLVGYAIVPREHYEMLADVAGAEAPDGDLVASSERAAKELWGRIIPKGFAVEPEVVSKPRTVAERIRDAWRELVR